MSYSHTPGLKLRRGGFFALRARSCSPHTCPCAILLLDNTDLKDGTPHPNPLQQLLVDLDSVDLKVVPF